MGKRIIMSSIITNPYINKKLGYYICDNLEFDSKIRVGLHAVQVGKPIQWVFNNKEFQTYDWTKEPEESLDFYYDQRARQLRETYDYIILSYSGGSDSHNIYESFRRQGLHIDEIITNTMTKASQGLVDTNSREAQDAPASEHERHTLPRLREIAQQMPATKITVTDQSDYLFESLEKSGDASWVLEKREGLNPAGATRFNYLHFSEVRKKFDKDKKIAMVVGIEKPRTLIHQGRFIMRFADRSTNMITVAEHLKEYPNSTVEFFYWSPDCVPLIIKQGHVIKRWLEINTHMQQHWIANKSSGAVHRLIHEPVLRELLYTTWNKDWFQAKKAILDWESEFDNWFRRGYSNTRAFYIWEEGLKFVEQNLTPFLRNSDVTGKVDGLQPVLHAYDLGKMKNLMPELNVWIR